jgi:flagellar protein FlaF
MQQPFSLLDQQTDSQPTLSASGGITRAYGKVMRQTESPRDMEYRVFSQVTATMEAMPSTATPGMRAEIIQRNRTLWDELGWAAVDDGNQLPSDLRSNIAGIAIWVKRESSRVLRENGSLQNLIDINKMIMGGLRPTSMGGSPECH